MRYTLAFLSGATVGATVVFLFAPSDGAANREWLRQKTDALAAGDSLVGGVVRGVRGYIGAQQARLDQAIALGKLAAERHEAELWHQLNLPPPELVPVPNPNPDTPTLPPPALE